MSTFLTLPRARLKGAALERLTVSGVFVGRQGVLEALRAKLDDALSSRGSVVMLAGQPGIGKTALAADLIGTKLRR